MQEGAISQNLRQLLQLHSGLSVSELARQTGIPQPTLHHLLNGTTQKPRREVLENLSRYFSISIPQLVGTVPLYQTIPDALKESLNIATIPIISWDMLPNWPITDKSIYELKQIILERQINEHAFALTMPDNSMEPLFPEKSLLIFDPSKQAKDREFVIVVLGKTKRVIFNRLFVDKTGIFIKQDQVDGNMQLLKLQPDIDKVIGTLTEVRIQL